MRNELIEHISSRSYKPFYKFTYSGLGIAYNHIRAALLKGADTLTLNIEGFIYTKDGKVVGDFLVEKFSDNKKGMLFVHRKVVKEMLETDLFLLKYITYSVEPEKIVIKFIEDREVE